MSDANNGAGRWIPVALQTVAVVGGFVVFALSNEHRISTLETKLDQQQRLIEQMTSIAQTNQQLIIDVLKEIKKPQGRH